MEPISSFGYWLRRRRKALDLTQDELAGQIGCAIGTLKKIETGERRPSKQMAERLADCLALPTPERAAFLKVARAELAVDALATYAAVRWAADRARSNKGPTLIEYFTYRAEGHSTSDDPTGYRPAGEPGAWPLGDPIERLKAHLIGLGEWDEERDQALTKELDATVRAAQKQAESMGILPQQGFDDIPSMFDDVYAEVPWHIAEQREEALGEAREFLGREPK